MDIFKSWIVEQYIAHRGFHNNIDTPENSLKAFQYAIDKGYAIELDVQQISDGTLVVCHDADLKRVANSDGYVKNLKKEDLKSLFLFGTNERIPTLQEVLDLVHDQVPLLIEIKNTNKVGNLEQTLLSTLKNYKGRFAIQAFNPYSLEYFKKYAPNIMRGQLSSYFKGINKLSLIKKFTLKRMLLNKSVSEPNFISYNAENLPNRYTKKLTIPVLAWTVKSQQQYEKVAKHCDNIIFEDFEPKL